VGDSVVRRVLVLGGYGFIGREVVRALRNGGFDVVGLGRSATLGERTLPDIRWIGADLNRLTDAGDWRAIVAGFDAIVNCSGGLQDDLRDSLARTQQRAITALVDACVAAGVRRFVQISAPGAAGDAQTGFLRTKGLADAHLAASGLDWTILRPALVIGRTAYGGTALVRMLACLPVAAVVHGDAPVQCVAVEELAEVVVQALEGQWVGAAFDLAEAEARPLRDVVALHRRWLGLPPARCAIDLPAWVAKVTAAFADLAALLGWRSALRSTAMRVMADGVRADPAATAARYGLTFADLPAILGRHAAGVPDRLAARLALLMPAIILSLALLWIGSGIATLANPAMAAAHLGPASAGNRLLVEAFAGVDILLGLAILWRRWARFAAAGMIAVTLAYLLGAMLLAPALWSDPLAPMLKAVVALVLAAVAMAGLDER